MNERVKSKSEKIEKKKRTRAKKNQKKIPKLVWIIVFILTIPGFYSKIPFMYFINELIFIFGYLMSIGFATMNESRYLIDPAECFLGSIGFLLTWCGLGYGMMLFLILDRIAHLPIMSDIPRNITLCSRIGLFLIILACILVIIPIFIFKLREKDFYISIPLIIFTIVIIMATIISNKLLALY